MKLLTVHSKDRSYGHAFQCLIPSPIPFKGKVKLVGVIMPLSLLPIRPPYNLFTYTVNGETSTIEIPTSYTTAEQLVADIHEQLPEGMAMGWNEKTQTCMLLSGPVTGPVTIHDTYLSNHLGLTGNGSGIPVTNPTAEIISSTVPVNLCFDTCLYISFDEWPTDNIGTYPYHCLFPILSNPGTVAISTENLTFPQHSIELPHPVGSIKISIRDVYGNIPTGQLDYQLIFSIED